ncbi:MAG: hypothetical protein M3N98_07225 [Actinomycetota bacterium]|nr:hypothetical protein [Actinomycetota bacterium]
MILAFTHEVYSLWWVAIGIGFVVCLVVIVLLSLLVAFVQDIDRYVASLWTTATTVARNTATTWMLGQTAAATGALRDETARHVQALAEKGGSR